MKLLGKYWKVLAAVLLAAAAIPVLFAGYLTGRQNYEAERASLEAMNQTLRETVAENARYADVDVEQLAGETERLNASRLALYRHFPVELLEEDQIMYVLYLEELFGTEITFSFGSVSAIESLSDGAGLGGLSLTVNYETTYDGFKDMIDYISTDSRITSLQYCTLDYDEASDTASGTLTLLCYTLSGYPQSEYSPPDVEEPETGKPNLFD